MDNLTLGDRMKEYERRNQYWLQRRTPVCIRVDIRAGHTFTRGFVRPFDKAFNNAMIRTMEYCAKNIGNCVFSYCQSDEITFILIDYEKLETEAWFGYRTDKLCSISASMATMAFNRFFKEETEAYRRRINNCFTCTTAEDELCTAYEKALEKGAMFDSRCFNIPKEEVTNLVYWRQLDASRNSIQMVGQAYFSHSELQGKSCNDIQDMLHEQHGINWNDFPTYQKRGAAWTKLHGVDYDMPILRGDGRAYIDNLVYIEKEV